MTPRANFGFVTKSSRLDPPPLFLTGESVTLQQRTNGNIGATSPFFPMSPFAFPWGLVLGRARFCVPVKVYLVIHPPIKSPPPFLVQLGPCHIPANLSRHGQSINGNTRNYVPFYFTPTLPKCYLELRQRPIFRILWAEFVSRKGKESAKQYPLSRDSHMKDLPSLCEGIRKALLHQEDVLFAYLLGSAARGDTTPQSDIDIAVYLRPSTTEWYLKREADLTANLISALRRAEIDLRILNAVPLVFQHEILKGGTLLFCRDELERVDFETRVMLRYFELKPYIEEYRSLLIQRIKGE